MKHVRKRQIPYDITYMWNLKYNSNEPIKKEKQPHGHRENTCCYQGGGMEWEDGVSTFKLFYT